MEPHLRPTYFSVFHYFLNVGATDKNKFPLHISKIFLGVQILVHLKCWSYLLQWSFRSPPRKSQRRRHRRRRQTPGQDQSLKQRHPTLSRRSFEKAALTGTSCKNLSLYIRDCQNNPDNPVSHKFRAVSHEEQMHGLEMGFGFVYGNVCVKPSIAIMTTNEITNPATVVKLYSSTMLYWVKPFLFVSFFFFLFFFFWGGEGVDRRGGITQNRLVDDDKGKKGSCF